MLTAMVLSLLGACPPHTFCNTTGAVAANALFHVEAIAADDVWAFGWGSPIHWNGSEWQPVPFPQNDRLGASLALAPNDIWMTGGMDVFHWDGAAWSKVDKGRKDGWAGPVVQLEPGEVWVLSDPFLRVKGGQLEPIDAKRMKAFGLAESFVTDAAVCAKNDLWIARAYRESPVLQHFDGTTVTRVPIGGRGQIYALSCHAGATWVFLETQVFKCSSSACVPVKAPTGARLVRGKTGPWVASEEGLHRWDGTQFVKKSDLPGRWYSGAARTDDDVWIVGEAGSTAHFDGTVATVSVSVDVGRLTDLSATRQGEVWAVGESGLFAFRKNAWAPIKSFPGQTRWGGRVWADSPTHVWVIAGDRAWRWGGAKWADLTPRQYAMDVWGRGENDVYLTTGEELLHREKDTWKVVATAPPGWSFREVEGDAEHVAVALRGPRPENADGPSTRLPDRVLVIDRKGQKTFELPYRENQLGFVLGELWVADRNGSISRRVNDAWVKLDSPATLFVPTLDGAVVVDRGGRGADWDGKTLTPFSLPMGELHHGVAAGKTVYLGGSHVILRRE